VGAEWAGAGDEAFAGRFIVGRSAQHGSAGLHVDAGGPVDAGDEGLGRQQLAIGRVQHIEQAVLVGLHGHVAFQSADGQVSDGDLLGGIEVVAIVRRGLVMPGVGAGVEMQRYDGGDVQVVIAMLRIPIGPGCAIAGAHQHQICLGS